MKPDLEIVVHVWAGQLPQYAHLARYQLSSLWLYPPQCRVQLSICYSPNDRLTCELLQVFAGRLPERATMAYFPMSEGRLCRRGIGRNLVARITKARTVYFAGCDYVWGPGCLDAICQQAELHPGKLLYPRGCMVHREHALGDAAIERAASTPFGALMAVDPGDFVPMRFDRAIGCLQIIPGDVARSKGYADTPEWQRPEPQWRRTFEDVAARRLWGLESQPISVPNLYRLRHTQAGRFV